MELLRRRRGPIRSRGVLRESPPTPKAEANTPHSYTNSPSPMTHVACSPRSRSTSVSASPRFPINSSSTTHQSFRPATTFSQISRKTWPNDTYRTRKIRRSSFDCFIDTGVRSRARRSRFSGQCIRNRRTSMAGSGRSRGASTRTLRIAGLERDASDVRGKTWVSWRLMSNHGDCSCIT